MQSPNASWNALVSGKLLSQSSGRAWSSSAWPTSWATTSVLAPDQVVLAPVVKWKNLRLSPS